MPYNESTGAVYLVVNDLDGKYYVGRTVRGVQLRWQEHCNPEVKSTRLYRAIKKYGKKAFSISILVEGVTELELAALERLWIIVLRSWDPTVGYNMTFGGDGGEIPTVETRKIISERLKKGYRSGRIAPWNKGIPATEEFRARVSAAKKGQCSEKLLIHLLKLARNQVGKPSGAKGSKRTLTQKMHQQEIQTGRRHLPESIRKQSEIRKNWWSNRSDEQKKLHLTKVMLTRKKNNKPSKNFRDVKRVCYSCFQSFSANGVSEQVFCSQSCKAKTMNRLRSQQNALLVA